MLTGSLGLFTGRSESGELGFHAILLFAAYPVDVFAGAIRIFLYLVVPAGFVTTAPARLIDDFDARWAAASVGVACGFAALAWLTFYRGLRRYSSGAVWTNA